VWTEEEDAVIIEKVNEIGTNWDMIAASLPGRNDMSIKDRWDSVLRQRCERDASGNFVLKEHSSEQNLADNDSALVRPLRRFRQFTPGEDRKIISLVEGQSPPINWSVISRSVPGRSSRQCQVRWMNYLSETLSKDAWSAEEDATILEKVNEFGPQWVKIAQLMPGRAEGQIKNRWYGYLVGHCDRDESGKFVLNRRDRPVSARRRKRTLLHSLSEEARGASVEPLPAPVEAACLDTLKRFTSEDDQLLTSLVEGQFSPIDWSEVSLLMSGRSAEQSRGRWESCLRAGEWTAEEDAMIVDKVNEMGTDWDAIARSVPGRSSDSLKTRWLSFLRQQCECDASGKFVMKGASPHEFASPPSSDDASDDRNVYLSDEDIEEFYGNP
jgi:hypothetical protein